MLHWVTGTMGTQILHNKKTSPLKRTTKFYNLDLTLTFSRCLIDYSFLIEQQITSILVPVSAVKMLKHKLTNSSFFLKNRYGYELPDNS